MSIVLVGSTSGSVTLQEPAVAGTTVLTLPAVSGTVITSNGSGDIQFNSGYGSVATAYGCRAWVNFNGTGTVAIRASGNVTSITDNGTGDYTVNFTTAMPDANIATIATSVNTSFSVSVAQTTTTTQIRTNTTAPALVDASIVNVAVFR
jgi:uncharacterized protein (AIM24 family)